MFGRVLITPNAGAGAGLTKAWKAHKAKHGDVTAAQYGAMPYKRHSLPALPPAAEDWEPADSELGDEFDWDASYKGGSRLFMI